MNNFFYRHAQFFLGFGFGLAVAAVLMLAGASKDATPSKAEVEALARSYGMVYKEEVLPFYDDARPEAETSPSTPEFAEPEVQVIQVYIPKGSAAEKIARILVEEGVIQDSQAFLERVKERRVSVKLEAGYFELAPNLTIDEVIDMLLVPGKEAAE